MYPEEYYKKEINIKSWDQYRVEAFKTWNSEIKDKKALEYIENKIIEELGEILGAYTKHKFHGKEANYTEEFGDVYWYLANYENIVKKSIISTTSSVVCSVSWMVKDTIRDFCSYSIAGANLSLLSKRLMYLMRDLNLNFLNILTENIKKVRKRHGTKYNRNHYKSV